MRYLASAAAFLLLASSLYADVTVSFLSGSASVLKNQKWTQAKTGMKLSKGDRVKTAADSKAMLTVDGTTRIWVSRNSEMQVSSSGKESMFDLLAGKLKARVKLLAGRKFSVKTPVCVASVRGTEFVLSSEGTLAVLAGRVDFGDLNLSNIVEVLSGQIGTMGQGGQPEAPREMTDEERNSLDGEFGPSDEQGGSQEGQQQQQESKKEELKEQLARLRSELREAVGDVKTDISAARELTNEIKESDLSAGRTLRDVHGNVVRVEQHLLRPDDRTLQLLNLTKRNEYAYADRLGLGWTYTGPGTARLDVIDVMIRMNMALPEQLTEWPSYISDRGDDMHPERVDIKLTNQEDVLHMTGVWKLRGELDEKGRELEDDGMVFASAINDYKVDMAYDANDDLSLPEGDVLREGDHDEGEDDLWMWGISPQMRVYKDLNSNDRFDEAEEAGTAKMVQLYTQFFAIDNNGSILNLDRFTSSSGNPFILLKEVAGEQIIFCRETDSTDFFRRSNLDLVVTPDLVLAVAQKLASQLGKLTGSDSSPDAGE